MTTWGGGEIKWDCGRKNVNRGKSQRENCQREKETNNVKRSNFTGPEHC